VDFRGLLLREKEAVMLVLGLGFERVVLGQNVKDTNFVRIVCVIKLEKY